MSSHAWDEPATYRFYNFGGSGSITQTWQKVKYTKCQ